MGTTILRVEKIKNMTNVRQSGAHQHRHHHETPNANQILTKNNVTLVGGDNLAKAVRERLDLLDKEPRKNAVLAVDGLLSLSPEIFRKEGGSPDNDILSDFVETSEAWLKERFGDNLVSAVLHLDETTPHIHFTVVPLEEKPDGRKTLNARDMFNKWQLADMQRGFNAAMSASIPTIESPKHGSKAKHTTIKQFYNIIDEAMEQIPIAAKEYLNEIKEGARQTLFDRYLPMVDKMIERVESELENKLSEEIKSDIRNKFNQEMQSSINNAFNETETLKKAQAKMDQVAQSAKLKIDTSDSKTSLSFKIG